MEANMTIAPGWGPINKAQPQPEPVSLSPAHPADYLSELWGSPDRLTRLDSMSPPEILTEIAVMERKLGADPTRSFQERDLCNRRWLMRQPDLPENLTKLANLPADVLVLDVPDENRGALIATGPRPGERIPGNPRDVMVVVPAKDSSADPIAAAHRVAKAADRPAIFCADWPDIGERRVEHLADLLREMQERDDSVAVTLCCESDKDARTIPATMTVRGGRPPVNAGPPVAPENWTAPITEQEREEFYGPTTQVGRTAAAAECGIYGMPTGSAPTQPVTR